MRLKDTSAVEKARARAESDRAGRRADANTRKLGRGAGTRRGRMPVTPATASRFHHNTKYSNKAGAHRAPTSATSKVAYDFALNDRDNESRVDFQFVSAAPGTPKKALDPILMAREAERTAGRQANCRQMAHSTVALPGDLSPAGRRALAQRIADEVRKRMDGVPVYGAVHAPDPGSDNWHVHLSHPIRHVKKIDDENFELGQRILYEQRPTARLDAGLPKTNHSDLREMRAAIAGHIADQLCQDGFDFHYAERWRQGHLTLGEQVERAAERGDVDFVCENFGRDPTKKEGPSTARWRDSSSDHTRSDAIAHNADAKVQSPEEPGPQMLTRTLLNAVLHQANKVGLVEPEQFRMLARDYGLSVTWVRRQGQGRQVQGVQFAIKGGPTLSGRQVGIPLGRLAQKLNWEKSPAYVRHPERSGPLWDAYVNAVQAAGIPLKPGSPIDTLPGCLTAVARRSNALLAQTRGVRDSGEHGPFPSPSLADAGRVFPQPFQLSPESSEVSMQLHDEYEQKAKKREQEERERREREQDRARAQAWWKALGTSERRQAALQEAGTSSPQRAWDHHKALDSRKRAEDRTVDQRQPLPDPITHLQPEGGKTALDQWDATEAAVQRFAKVVGANLVTTAPTPVGMTSGTAGANVNGPAHEQGAPNSTVKTGKEPWAVPPQQLGISKEVPSASTVEIPSPSIVPMSVPMDGLHGVRGLGVGRSGTAAQRSGQHADRQQRNRG